MSETSSAKWILDAVGQSRLHDLAQQTLRERLSFQPLYESLSAARTHVESDSTKAAALCDGHSECVRLCASLELLGGLIAIESITRFRVLIDVLQKRLREVADMALVQTQLRFFVDQQIDPAAAAEWQKALSLAQREFTQRHQTFWNWATPQMLQELRDLAEVVVGDCTTLIAEVFPIQSQTAVSHEQALQHYEVELRMLRQLGVICSEATTEDELLERATVLIADTLFPDNCGFLLLDTDRGVLVTHPSFVLSDPNVSLSDKALGIGITGQVAQTGVARRVGDVSLEPGYLAADSRSRSELCLPMKINSIVVGVLNVESDQQNAFSESDEHLAGTVVGLVGNSLERLRFEHAARESEQYFALFMQHLPGLAWIKDDRGRYVFVNAAAEEAFGISLSLIAGRTDDELFPAETAAQFKENDARALKSGTEVRTIELLKHKDGLVHHSIVSKFSLPSSTRGSLFVGGVAIDITEHKQADESLRKVSAFRETIVRMAAEGICVCHGIPDFPYVTFLVWNERMTEMTGYTLEEINRLGWYQTMYPDLELQQRAINRMSEMRDGNDMRAEEWEITRKDGVRRIFAISTSIVEMNEKAVCVMAVMLDVTERKLADQKLRMMQFSVDHSSDAIVWVAPDARILYANEAASQRLGYSNDEFLQKFVFDFDPDFPAVAWPEHWEELKQRRSMVFESRHQAKGGQIIGVEINANYVNFDGLEFNFASSRDITERKRTEAALRENEERFRLLYEGANDAIFWADAMTGTLTNCNPAAEALLGRDRSEIIGQPQSILHPPEEVERYRGMFQEHASSKSKEPFELEVIRKDGRRVDVSISPSVTVISGQPIIQGIFRDISERKRAEKLRQESEDRLRAVIRHAPNVAIQWYDADGRVTLWNEASEAMFGFTAAEAVGKTLDQLILSPEENAVFLETLASISRTKQTVGPTEYKFHRSRGEQGICLSNIFMIPGDDVSNWFVRMDVDVTEQKRIEAEMSLRQRDLLHASRLNAIGQMVAGLSHEVAQPLNAITNFAMASTRLLESDADEKLDIEEQSDADEKLESLKQYVQAITDQSRRCAAILRRLRDFSRRTPTQKDQCDLNQILWESFEWVSAEMRQNSTRVRLDLSTTLPVVWVDRVQIQQVVINMLTNALDALRVQSPERRQITIRSMNEVEFAVFEVEDNGPGIAPEIAQRLFEPFFTTKTEGMGIGLNICETIVRNHGGKIVVTSNELGGATFRVQLPFQLNDEVTS